MSVLFGLPDEPCRAQILAQYAQHLAAQELAVGGPLQAERVVCCCCRGHCVLCAGCAGGPVLGGGGLCCSQQLRGGLQELCTLQTLMPADQCLAGGLLAQGMSQPWLALHQQPPQMAATGSLRVL